MKDKLLTLLIIIGMIAILGCVSNTINTTQNNTTTNNTNYSNIIDGVLVDAVNYNDSLNLTASQKLSAIKIALQDEQLQGYLQKNTTKSVHEVLLSNNTIKSVRLDSGFLNTSDIVVSVPIDIGGAGPPYWLTIFNVYVDITSGKVTGVDYYDVRGQDSFTRTNLPANSYWYHQLAGSTRKDQDYNTTRMSLSVITSYNNTYMIHPLILDAENFKKFRNGSHYEALQYIDYNTNKTHMIDGKTSLHPQNIHNGTAAWFANISISYRSPAEVDFFGPTNYYIVLQNNANREIPVILNVYTTYFFP